MLASQKPKNNNTARTRLTVQGDCEIVNVLLPLTDGKIKIKTNKNKNLCEEEKQLLKSNISMSSKYELFFRVMKDHEGKIS